MDVFVARQPIFDVKQEVYGYELLYRSGEQNSFTGVDGDEASLAVIRNFLLVIGTERISGGGKAFVNFTKNLLLRGMATLLPVTIGVVEILEDIEPSPELVEALKLLRSRGYTLALDDFILRGNENNPFLDLVDIIKVDFRLAGVQEREDIAKKFLEKGTVRLLAEKTETREDVDQAIKLGYTLFQGYFFCKPVIISRKDIPGYKINYLRILKELGAEDLDYRSIEEIISHDPALAFKLLKYINSAHFGMKQQVTSIKRALGILGEKEIKKWASIAVVMEFGRDQPLELLRLSLLRARLCEMLADTLDCGEDRSSFFLMGLFSLMDVLLGRPMEEILEEIPIQAAPKAALLGKPNEHKDIFDLVVCYEKAHWESILESTSRFKIDVSEISRNYMEALKWVDGAFL
ncbi:MAG: EAL and HDOD domain-containing protein [Syntrophobacteraceae bacterium]